jgi:hypothetical protein
MVIAVLRGKITSRDGKPFADGVPALEQKMARGGPCRFEPQPGNWWKVMVSRVSGLSRRTVVIATNGAAGVKKS